MNINHKFNKAMIKQTRKPIKSMLINILRYMEAKHLS